MSSDIEVVSEDRIDSHETLSSVGSDVVGVLEAPEPPIDPIALSAFS